MNGMDRAGRKKQILRVMRDWEKRRRGATMNAGMIARRVGMVSSTHLKNILKEMVSDGDIEALSTAPNRYGQTFQCWRVAHYEEVELPGIREITINGQKTKFDERMWEI